MPTLRSHEFWALRDLSFTLGPGEALGIVGDNGAGKTTLLRLLQGITAPDWGSVAVAGRSAALIELGTAFDEYATGREAIATEGAVLGYSSGDIRELEDEIIEFSELRTVIDAPIRTYSLGMRMRLGYAIAAHTHPDLLIIDEVLSVGDVAFQRKCIRLLLKHLDNGGTLVIASHDMWQIRQLCSRCIVLDRGRIIAEGDVPESLGIYMGRSAAAANSQRAPTQVGDTSSASISILQCSLFAPDGGAVVTGGDGVLSLEVDNAGPPVEVRCLVALGPRDLPITAVSAATPRETPLRLPSGRSTIHCAFEGMVLSAADYAVRAAILPREGKTLLGSVGWLDEPLTVNVEEPPGEDQSPYQILGALGVLRPIWPPDDLPSPSLVDVNPPG